MKQTAVQWLEDKIQSDMTFMEILGLINQAKAMEKEQIIDAYLKDRRGEFDKMLRLIYDAKKYYTENYESKTNL